MHREISRRLDHGFVQLGRDRHVKARLLDLSDEEYRLWDLFHSLVDWHPHHEEKYNTVTVTGSDIADLCGWSQSKAWRVCDRLIKKDILLRLEINTYILKVSCTIEPILYKTKDYKLVNKKIS